MKLQVEVLMAFVLCAMTLPIPGGSRGNGIFPSPKLSPIVPSDGPQAAIPAYLDNQPKLNAPTPAIISRDISPRVLSPKNEAPPPVAQIIQPQVPSPSIQLISPSVSPSSVPVQVSSRASPPSAEIPSPSTRPTAAGVPPSSSFSPSSLPHTRRGIANGTLPGSGAPLGGSAAPVSSPLIDMPAKPPTGNPIIFGPPPAAHSTILGPPPSLNEPKIPPTLSLSPLIHGNVNTAPAAEPAAAPSKDSPSHHLPAKGLVPASSPKPNDNLNSSNIAPSPLITNSYSQKGRKDQPPASSPTNSFHRQISGGSGSPSPLPGHQEPSISSLPSPSPKAMTRNQSINHASPPLRVSSSPAQSPRSSVHLREALAPAPAESSNRSYGPILPPLLSIPGFPPMASRSKRHYHFSAPVSAPTGSFHGVAESPKGPLPQALSPPPTPMPLPARALPPPPPNMDCASWVCTDPFTNSPPGSPCACVRPMKIGLRLNIALYTFFPLVPELAQEIASGTLMKQSQVRIMGANAATEQPQKTVVLIDLVPRGQMFDNTTAYLTSEKFWHKQVGIKATYFGHYDVLYVSYPGLPPSPPMPPGGINVDDGSISDENNSRTLHPLGVDVGKRKAKFSGSLIVIVILSSIIALVLCVGTAWIFLLRHTDRAHHPGQTSRALLPFFSKASVAGPMVSGSAPSSVTGSFSSNMAAYTGSAKTFSAGEMERATNKFEESGVIGEGGFGRVYKGTLEDGTVVAVKVLKRDDQQGGREFLAEVEMLSRLHHRNLVKLLGICTEEHLRCLVYELIPNGSVESHLHGVDKDIATLDWSVRMKIALGSARGLAYLHEDSSPRVIHRDFKSSNILLESDFTPKVSDFGLARTALEEGNEHISTRVMGTFGYVAPEYAMTGHLLVKSDVYSYGVVLLELLTGRKPVDMLQPSGQENLVTWARPLLTSKEGLEIIIDPVLGPDFPFESMAKVAAIASMCVQPEVSHRPFMGEVVQALKLVCNENDEHIASGSCSQDDSFVKDPEARISTLLVPKTNDGRVLSASEIFSTSEKLADDASGSFRRHSSSGPLRPSRSGQFWKKLRSLSRGSMSDHGRTLRFKADGDKWP